MMQMSALEGNVIKAILKKNASSNLIFQDIMRNLVMANREFTEDALDRSRCCGFYLNFETNIALRNIHKVGADFGVQGTHPDLPLGVDFILFVNSDGGIEFLEATFYGYSLPIADVLSEESGFQLTFQ